MGGPCKVIPGFPCDQLRTHLPPQCQQGPLLWEGGRPDVQFQISGKLVSCLLGGKKFSDAKVLGLWDPVRVPH